MSTRRIIPVLLTVLCAARCASTPQASVSSITTLNIDQKVKVEDRARKVSAALDQPQREALQKDLDALIAYCQPTLTGLENSSRSRAKWAFAVSMAGLVAGAIVAPALVAANAQANAAWIAAFSGFGGAMNTASIALETSGLSGTAAARDRNTIIERIRTDLVVIVDPAKTLEEIRTSLLAARAECALYQITVPTIPSR